MTDREPGAAGAPDITATVMQRLGYRQVTCESERRSWRRRTTAMRALQAATVATALALCAAWWLGGFDRSRTRPAVGEALRGSVARGAGQLDAILLGLPKVPSKSPVQSADADRANATAGGPDQPAPVRSY